MGYQRKASEQDASKDVCGGGKRVCMVGVFRVMYIGRESIHLLLNMYPVTFHCLSVNPTCVGYIHRNRGHWSV
jgi:hypothetical protein